MPGEIMDPVVGLSEDAKNPLHYPGKTYSLSRMNDHMKMIAHYREIIYAELESLFCLRDDFKKQGLCSRRIQKHFLPVYPRRYMVCSMIFQISWLSHNKA